MAVVMCSGVLSPPLSPFVHHIPAVPHPYNVLQQRQVPFCEGIAITSPQYRVLQVFGSSTIRYRQCYHTSFHDTPHYYGRHKLP